MQPIRPTPKQTSLLPVGLFTAAYLAIATPYSIAKNNIEFLFYIGVVIIFAVIVVALHRKVNFSQGVLWGLSLWGLVHMLGGLVRVPPGWTDNDSGYLYSMWWIPGYLKYDQVVHAFGFAISTWVCWQCIRTAKGIEPTAGILTLCALGGMGLGSVNEIIEFAAVLMIPGTNVGGYINTGWDLVANAVGSITTVMLIKMYHRA
jgi:uncharacterized membrane protein YjdF